MAHSKIVKIKSLEAWGDLSKQILKALASYLSTQAETERKATVLALRGDLGAGKTTFTQYLGKELGVETQISSPTFNIMKIYQLPEPEAEPSDFTHLVHLDVYRFDDKNELAPLRFSDYLQEKGNLVVVEWADKINEALPPETVFLDFVTVSENERQVTISGPRQLVDSL